MTSRIGTTSTESKCTDGVMSTLSLKHVTLVVIAGNVALVTILAVRTGLHRELHQPATCSKEMDGDGMKEEHSRYCFRAEMEECLERGYVLKISGNDTVCCRNLNDHVYSLLSEVIPEKLSSDAAKARALSSVKRYMAQLQQDPKAVQLRAAAHVGILPNGNFTGPDSEAPRVQWEKSGERSLLSGGVIHGVDRLTVTKAGYYYVYTGLQFDVDAQTVEYGAIVAYVYRNINGTKASRRKLMMARESSCRTTRNGTRGPVSMYMAGIFLLRNHDEISVRTPSQSLLHRSSATTYMGIHMV